MGNSAGQAIVRVQFAHPGRDAMTHCDMTADGVRAYAAALRSAASKCRSDEPGIYVTIPNDGRTFAFLPAEAIEEARKLDEAASQALARRGATPTGKVEAITRDEHGEMVKIETVYRF